MSDASFPPRSSCEDTFGLMLDAFHEHIAALHELPSNLGIYRGASQLLTLMEDFGAARGDIKAILRPLRESLLTAYVAVPPDPR